MIKGAIVAPFGFTKGMVGVTLLSLVNPVVLSKIARGTVSYVKLPVNMGPED